MKMTNEEMASSIDVMTGLQETGKLGYAIARNLRKLKEECAEYLDIRAQAFQKYGDDAGDGRFSVPAERVPQFLAEIEEIGGIEQNVDIFKVPAETFFGGTLTSGQMEALLWMVEEG